MSYEAKQEQWFQNEIKSLQDRITQLESDEPHLRRKHRQELLDELIEVAQVNQLTIDGFGGPDILADWLTEWKMDED